MQHKSEFTAPYRWTVKRSENLGSAKYFFDVFLNDKLLFKRIQAQTARDAINKARESSLWLANNVEG